MCHAKLSRLKAQWGELFAKRATTPCSWILHGLVNCSDFYYLNFSHHFHLFGAQFLIFVELGTFSFPQSDHFGATPFAWAKTTIAVEQKGSISAALYWAIIIISSGSQGICKSMRLPRKSIFQSNKSTVTFYRKSKYHSLNCLVYWLSCRRLCPFAWPANWE